LIAFLGPSLAQAQAKLRAIMSKRNAIKSLIFGGLGPLTHDYFTMDMPQKGTRASQKSLLF